MSDKQIEEFMDEMLAEEKKAIYAAMQGRQGAEGCGGEEFIADENDWTASEPADANENAIYDDGYYAGMAKAFALVRQFIKCGHSYDCASSTGIDSHGCCNNPK